MTTSDAMPDVEPIDLASFSPDGLVLLDSDGRIVAVNAAAALQSGYAPEEMVGLHAVGFVHPDDLWEAANALRRSAPGVSHAPSVHRLRRADGTYFTAEVQGSNLLDHPSVGGLLLSIRDISNRRDIVEALSAAEETFEVVLRYASEVVLLADERGRVQYVSPAFVATTGWRPEDVMGMRPAELVHPDDLPAFAEVAKPVFASPGAQATAEFRLRRRSGAWRYCDALMVNLLDHPAVGRVALYVRDITERKAAEDALTFSEQRFRSLVQHSSDITVVYRPDGIVTYVSPSIVTCMGYEPDEGVGAHLLDYIHPEDRHRSLRMTMRLLRDPNGRIVEEIRMLHRDGSYRMFEVGVVNLVDDPAVGGFVCNARDITDRRAAEMARAEMEERFASAFENAPIGMALQDLDGTFLLVNRALCELLGYERSELLAMAGTAVTHPDDRDDQQALEQRVVTGEIDGYQCEKRFVRSDGRIVWGKLSVSAVYGADGRPSYVIAHIEDVTGRRRDEERLTHQALHDALTGLPNRALLLDRLGLALARAKRGGPLVALLFCDLDRFKLVNDSLGHQVGDRLLVEASHRLRGVVRGGDTVARFGGDEFVVLCADVRDHEEVIVVAERIARALEEPFVLDGAEFVVSTSIGIAFCGDGVEEPADLLRDADAAMYRAKESGRARYAVFQPEMRSSVMRWAETERALRRAADDDQLRLAYQPLVDLLTGEVVGAEALVRWEHPTRGLLPPGEFVPLAEETGLIVPVGRWVVGEACRQAAEWRGAGILPADFLVAVNVSVRQLRDPQFVEGVVDTLRRHGVETANLCFELTESALADDGGAAVRVLRRLRDLGARLAIDDFGTGYSALSHLKRFPFDTLKIDRSFVAGLGRDAEDEAIVAAVVGVARALDLRVVAEGVETEKQRDALVGHGIAVGQGFLFGGPVTAPDLAERLASAD